MTKDPERMFTAVGMYVVGGVMMVVIIALIIVVGNFLLST